MIKYNTQEKRLHLPEYGRTMQKLVDHCLTIEDRDVRTRCAKKIAHLMSVQFPHIVGQNGDNTKIWNHINMMADFNLDIDFPVEIKDKDSEKQHPEKLTYPEPTLKYRHYGKNIQSMICQVAEMENCIEKDQLIFLIANQMKKLLVSQNPEVATDVKVFNDIKEISGNVIQIDPEAYRLNEYLGINTSANISNKKKKKK